MYPALALLAVITPAAPQPYIEYEPGSADCRPPLFDPALRAADFKQAFDIMWPQADADTTGQSSITITAKNKAFTRVVSFTVLPNKSVVLIGTESNGFTKSYAIKSELLEDIGMR